MLADGDNELLVNFSNLTSVRMLLNTVSKRGSFKLTEFLFSESGVVKEGDEYYTNQVVVSFYNEKKLTQKAQIHSCTSKNDYLDLILLHQKHVL